MISIPLISFLSKKINNENLNKKNKEFNSSENSNEKETEFAQTESFEKNESDDNSSPSNDKNDAKNLKNILSEEVSMINKSASNKVIKISRSNFLKGALAAEIPLKFHKEALKAQVIALNTFYQYKKNNSEKTGKSKIFKVNNGTTFDFINDYELRNRWKDNYETNMNIIKNIVDESINEIIVDSDGNPILACFHAISPGMMTNCCCDVFNEDLPYLRGVNSQFDSKNPNFKTQTCINIKDFKKRVKEKFNLTSNNNNCEKWFKITEQKNNKLVKTAEIYGNKKNGSEIRETFNLKSSNFDFEFKNKQFIFTTYGHGHGVGMSQHGANALALQGYDYKKILEHFYPNTQIKSFD